MKKEQKGSFYIHIQIYYNNKMSQVVLEPVPSAHKNLVANNTTDYASAAHAKFHYKLSLNRIALTMLSPLFLD